jgi:hypothetical protein
MNLKIKLNCIIIILSRLVDLYSTHVSVIDFKEQETNFLVKIFNLNFWEFCLIDVLLAFLLVILYLYSVKKSSLFRINESNFFSYTKKYLYKKKILTLYEYIFSMSFVRVLILFGTVVPIYIFITSLIFSLNNLWVYLFNRNYSFAVNSYNLLSSYCFFDILIFILPIIILIFQLYNKLKNEYYLYNSIIK